MNWTDNLHEKTEPREGASHIMHSISDLYDAGKFEQVNRDIQEIDLNLLNKTQLHCLRICIGWAKHEPEMTHALEVISKVDLRMDCQIRADGCRRIQRVMRIAKDGTQELTCYNCYNYRDL